MQRCVCDLESSPPGSFTDRVIVVNVFQFHNKSLSAFFFFNFYSPFGKKCSTTHIVPLV